MNKFSEIFQQLSLDLETQETHYQLSKVPWLTFLPDDFQQTSKVQQHSQWPQQFPHCVFSFMSTTYFSFCYCAVLPCTNLFICQDITSKYRGSNERKVYVSIKTICRQVQQGGQMALDHEIVKRPRFFLYYFFAIHYLLYLR